MSFANFLHDFFLTVGIIAGSVVTIVAAIGFVMAAIENLNIRN